MGKHGVGLAIDGGKPVISKRLPPWPWFGEMTISAAQKPLETGNVNYWTGKLGMEFQRRWARYCGTKHAVALNSGTSALHVAYASLGIGPGDEVIVPSYTFIATACAVLNQMAIPIFADVNLDDHCISVSSIREKITDRTKAISVVHLYGIVVDMDPILELARKHSLYVVEDAAQAHGGEYKGKKVGNLGDVAAFSFCQDKIFTTGGEGGMVTTSSDRYAEIARSFKDHGYHEEERRGLLEMEALYLYIHHRMGFNYRMTEMQSAIGIEELKKLDSWNLKRRRRNALFLADKIRDLPCIERLPLDTRNRRNAYYKYPIVLRLEGLKVDRDRFCRALQKEGLRAAIGDWPENYKEEVFQKQVGFGESGYPFTSPLNRPGAGDYSKVYCPNAAYLGERTIKLQVHPTLELEHMELVAKAVRKVAEAYMK